MPTATARHLDKFPTFSSFELAYNPDLQVWAVCNPDRCFGGESPTLADLARKFSNGEAVTWVLNHLYKYQKLALTSNKLKEETLIATAKYVCAQFYWLKCSEIILFFGYCVLGKFDDYFGNKFDVPAVLKALRQFVNQDRANYLCKMQK